MRHHQTTWRTCRQEGAEVSSSDDPELCGHLSEERFLVDGSHLD